MCYFTLRFCFHDEVSSEKPGIAREFCCVRSKPLEGIALMRSTIADETLVDLRAVRAAPESNGHDKTVDGVD